MVDHIGFEPIWYPVCQTGGHPKQPHNPYKSDFQATSKITTPLRPVELSAVLCPWRFPVSTRSLTYTRSDGTYSNICGAGGDSGTRTHTTSRPSDFESDTSTDSIISPCVRILIRVPRTLIQEKRISGCAPPQQHHWPGFHFWLKPLANKLPSILAPDSRAVRLSLRTTSKKCFWLTHNLPVSVQKF